MTNKPNPSVLLLGLSNIGGLKAFDWNEVEHANPSDYEVVVVNCHSLISYLKKVNKTGRNKLQQRLKQLGVYIAKLVSSKGIAIVICPQNRFIGYTVDHELYGSRQIEYDCLGWLPIGFSQIQEEGNNFDVLEKSWRRYFDSLKNWNFYFKVEPTATQVWDGWNDL